MTQNSSSSSSLSFSSASPSSSFNSNISCITLDSDTVDGSQPELTQTIDTPWSINDFEKGKILGKGRFGKVYLVRERRSEQGLIVALKVISKEIILKYQVETTFKNEVELQTSLEHPNIVKLFGWFHDDYRVYLILEFAPNGTLFDKLNQVGGPLTDTEAATYTYQLANALDYMHSKDIIHRDVKPENILIGVNGEAKLGDFGWSCLCQVIYDESHNKTLGCTGTAGTVDYLPPEMVENRTYNTKADNWCLGVLVYELLVGKAPFHSTNEATTREKIRKTSYLLPDHLDFTAQELIRNLLQKNPEKRIELKNVLKCEWINYYRKKEKKKTSLVPSLKPKSTR